MRDIPITRRLSFRLTVAISAVTLGTFGLLVHFGLRAQRSHLEDVATRVASLLSESIRSSTHASMLADRRADAYQTMEAIGRGEGIERVRVFNKEGRITFSTHAEEIGSLVDTRAESCYACHAAGRPLERLSLPSRSRIYRWNGHRVLAMVTPIYNETSCASAGCHAHPRDKRVLGVVDVGISLQGVDQSLAVLERRTLATAAGAMLAIAGGVLFFTNRVVVRPVAALLEGTRRVAQGDLSHRLAVKGEGELGRLGASFDRMTESLAAAQQEIRGLMDGLEKKVDERTAALKEAQAQLVHAAKMASLGRLAASIAHEINNPLTGILTFARVIRHSMSGSFGDPQRQESLRQLQMIERETERCTAIVRNLLEFARQRPLSLADASPNAAIEEALSLVGHQIALKEVTLEKQLGEVPPLRADFGQLRQAFVNVILNACDAMTRGGMLRVTTGVASDGRAEIRFEDTGSGISPENMTRIFDPFFTTKEMGTGLGLSVVYGIVERHGGELLVSSEIGKGTVIRMLFPPSRAQEAGAKPA